MSSRDDLPMHRSPLISRRDLAEPADAQIARAVYSFQILMATRGRHKGQYEWIVFWRATRVFAQGGWAPSFAAAFQAASAARIALVREEFPHGARWH